MEKQNDFFNGIGTNVDEKIKRLREKEGYVPPFEEIKRVVVNKKIGKEIFSEVFVILRVDNKEEEERIKGVGDINTLHLALRSILSRYYNIGNIRVEEIIHHAIGSGTEAFAQVILSMENHKRGWRVSGKSESVIEAGWQALLKGYEYALSFHRKKGGRKWKN